MRPAVSLHRTFSLPFAHRKAAASVLAVDERQSLQTLTRDEKTASRTLSQLKDKSEQQTQKREKLAEEERTLSQKASEVCTSPGSVVHRLTGHRAARNEGLRAGCRAQTCQAGASQPAGRADPHRVSTSQECCLCSTNDRCTGNSRRRRTRSW